MCVCVYTYCCSVAMLCPTHCDSVNCSMPDLAVLHYLPEFAQTHVHISCIYIYTHTYIYIYTHIHTHVKMLPNGSVGKEYTCNTGDTGDLGFIPGLERSPRGEWLLGQQEAHTNKVNQQVSDRVCELQRAASSLLSLSLPQESPL